jgi:hypothetical protein
MNDFVIQAIQVLRPGSEFTIQNDDYSTIEWHVLEGTAPTTAQINAKVTELQNAQNAAEAAKAAAAASAVAKLEAIGLTAEEIAALRG